MKEETTSKVSFWAYDIFGYLLPGLILLAGVAKSNMWLYNSIEPHWASGNYLDYAILIGVTYTIGHIVSGFSSYIFERLLLRYLLGYPTSQMFKPINNTPKLVKLLSPGYFRPYSKPFQERFDSLFHREFGMPASQDHDRFWLAWSMRQR